MGEWLGLIFWTVFQELRNKMKGCFCNKIEDRKMWIIVATHHLEKLSLHGFIANSITSGLVMVWLRFLKQNLGYAVYNDCSKSQW